jgi:hypothetical protein
MFTPLGQMSCSLKPNVMHSQDKCPTPLRQMSYTLKAMTLGCNSPKPLNQDFCVFDANTHLK